MLPPIAQLGFAWIWLRIVEHRQALKERMPLVTTAELAAAASAAVASRLNVIMLEHAEGSWPWAGRRLR
jgi:hypothetical protein